MQLGGDLAKKLTAASLERPDPKAGHKFSVQRVIRQTGLRNNLQKQETTKTTTWNPKKSQFLEQ